MGSVRTNEYWVALRTDGERQPAGTLEDPYDGSSPTVFDSSMAMCVDNSTIHIGPGIFQTRGYKEDVGGVWQPRNGQRIIGAGIDVTVLKLVDAMSDPPAHAFFKYYVVGGKTWLDSFELSDLTIDCNMSGQPEAQGYDFPPLCCAGILVLGRHIRIRRVRVINFGTQKGFVFGESPAHWLECFPIIATYATPVFKENYNCVVEDCVIEKPAMNNSWITTGILLAGGERDTDGVTAYHRGCVVRDCLLNFEYTDNPVGIAGISYSGTTATVTTKWPHNRGLGQWVVVTGALENGTTSANYNGSFQISAVLSATQFQYAMPGTPTAQPTGEMFIGKFPSRIVMIDYSDPNDPPIVVSASGMPPTYSVTVKTSRPHFRVVGHNVVLNAVTVGNITSNALNGSHRITDIPSPTKLTFVLTSDPGTPDAHPGTPTPPFIGSIFQGITADVGVGAIVENNRVFNCESAYYHDSYTTKDIIIRKNHFYAVTKGVNQSLGDWSAAKNCASLTNSLSVAIFTTPLPHGFSKGQGVRVDNARVNGVPPDQYPSLYYNGIFPIASIPAPNKFTYQMTGDPGAYADGTPIPTFAGYWQVANQIIEKNLIELVFEINQYTFNNFWGGYPSGVYMPSSKPLPATLPPYLYSKVLTRRNLIRNIDNGFDPSGRPVGITLNSCQSAIIDDNVVGLNCASNNIPYNVAVANFATARCFNNQAPDGKLIEGYDASTGKNLNELAAQVDLGLFQTV